MKVKSKVRAGRPNYCSPIGFPKVPGGGPVFAF